MMILQFSAMILLSPCLTVILRLIEKKYKLKKTGLRNLIIGVLFGLAAVYGTECGVDTGMAIYNTRDASVICAGIFGWQPALIAAIIGSTERFLAPLWGVGSYTRWACSIATLEAGLFTVYLTKNFYKRKPTWFEGFLSAACIEIFHMLMVFVTHPKDMHTAGTIIQTMTVPMILINAVSVTIAILITDSIDKIKISMPDKNSISVQFNYGLFTAMSIALILSVGFTAIFQRTVRITDTTTLLEKTISETQIDLDFHPENATDPEFYRRIGTSGYLVISKTFEPGDTPEMTVFKDSFYGTDSYCMYKVYKGHTLLAILPEEEAEFSERVSVTLSIFMEFLVIGLLFLMVTTLIRRLVIDDIESINQDLAKITQGDLSVELKIDTNKEFRSLSFGINNTVDKLGKLIEEANTRIDKELAFAKQIQEGSLPSVFPPYPERTDFDIYATMDAAKEIGGDFYDFFMLGGNRLFFLIADVSGKGIPAALFMMRAKTLIRTLAESGLSVCEVAQAANNALCENNEAGLFVTAWLGCLDLATGKLTYTNAGHNPPVLLKKDNNPTFIRDVSGFVLAGLENTPYKQYELTLLPEDRLFLYTDGVTEATDSQFRLYSEERLISVLDATDPQDNITSVCARVRKDIDTFVKEAEQFDDITMLCIKYNGLKENSK